MSLVAQRIGAEHRPANRGGDAGNAPTRTAREAPLWLLGLFYTFGVSAVAVAMAIFASRALDPIIRATGGLVNDTLLFNLVLLLVGVGGLLLGLGRLSPVDLGLDRRKVLPALATTLIIWLAVQAAVAIASLAAGGTLAVDPLWGRRGTTVVVGLLVAQLLGNALFEEVGYRGFLLTQCRLKLERTFPQQPRLALAVGLVISQGLFALMHVPNRLANGVDWVSLPAVLLGPFLLGLLFAAIYLRTGNLFLGVGVHALVNTPTALFVSPVPPSLFVVAWGLLLLLPWRRHLPGPFAWAGTRGNPAPRPAAGARR